MSRVAKIRQCTSQCERAPGSSSRRGSPEWQSAYNSCFSRCSSVGYSPVVASMSVNRAPATRRHSAGGSGNGDEFYNPLYKARIYDSPIYTPDLTMARFAGYDTVRARMERAASAPRSARKSASSRSMAATRPRRVATKKRRSAVAKRKPTGSRRVY